MNAIKRRRTVKQKMTQLLWTNKKKLSESRKYHILYIEIEFKRFFIPSRRFELFRWVIDSCIIIIFDEENPNRTNVVVAVELVVVYEQNKKIKLRNRKSSAVVLFRTRLASFSYPLYKDTCQTSYDLGFTTSRTKYCSRDENCGKFVANLTVANLR